MGVYKMKKIFMLLSYSGLGLLGCNLGSHNLSGSAEPSNLKVQNGDVSSNPTLNAMVPLIYNVKLGSLCSSTFLTESTILTAAHCVINMRNKNAGETYNKNDIVDIRDIKILAAANPDYGPVSTSNPLSYIVRNVKKINIHDQTFKGVVTRDNGQLVIVDDKEVNDLAIIQLESPVRFSAKYKYPLLADRTYGQFTPLITAGYGINFGAGVVKPDPYDGQSGILRVANTHLSYYNGNYTAFGVIRTESGIYYKTCRGDSGGPDFLGQALSNKMESFLTLTIAGVHSYGSSGVGCGIPYSPGTSISVAANYSWIKKQMAINPDNSTLKVGMQICRSPEDKSCNLSLSDINENETGIVRLFMTPAEAGAIINNFNLKSISFVKNDGWQIAKIEPNCISHNLTEKEPCVVIMNYSPVRQSREHGSLYIRYLFKDMDNFIKDSTYKLEYSRK